MSPRFFGHFESAQKWLNFGMWASFYLRNIAQKFFCWGALRSREITYAKNSVFQAASFGDLLLNEKQKKHYFVEQQTGRLFMLHCTES